MKRNIKHVLLLLSTLLVLGGCSEPKELNTYNQIKNTVQEVLVNEQNESKEDSNSTNSKDVTSKKDESSSKNETSSQDETTSSGEGSKESKDKVKKEELKIHFIDVGQADSILIQLGKQGMLIDAGNNSDGDMVSQYIKDTGITKLEYVIGTHPHEDHVGGLDVVIKNHSIGKVFLPKYTVSTKTYKDVLDAIEDKKLKITSPVVGDEYQLGEASFLIIAPNKEDYGDNPNNYSIGIKLTYGETTFVSVGDAEEVVEKDILANGIDLEADIFKVSHHGSNTSNSKAFLSAIDPVYAVISVGEDNKYGHPSSNVVTTMQDDDIMIYRTDKNGTVVITSDGKNLSFKTTGSSQTSKKETTKENNREIIVYVTSSGAKYHVDGCRFLNDSKKEYKLSEAIENGYTACKVCDAPTK